MTNLPRCSECGGEVQLLAKSGRARMLFRDIIVSIPDNFKVPTCAKCSEEFMIPEVSIYLDCELQSSLGERCPTPVDKQLEYLRTLPKGWYDSTSSAFEPEALSWLSKLLMVLVEALKLPQPYIYPTPEGLVRIEWPGKNCEIITTFNLHLRTVNALAVRLDSNKMYGISVLLTGADGEAKLRQFLIDHWKI